MSVGADKTRRGIVIAAAIAYLIAAGLTVAVVVGVSPFPWWLVASVAGSAIGLTVFGWRLPEAAARFVPFVGIRYLRGPQHGWSPLLLAIAGFFALTAIVGIVGGKLLFEPVRMLSGPGAHLWKHSAVLGGGALLVLCVLCTESLMLGVRSSRLRWAARVVSIALLAMGAIRGASAFEMCLLGFAAVWVLVPWLPSSNTVAHRIFLRALGAAAGATAVVFVVADSSDDTGIVFVQAARILFEAVPRIVAVVACFAAFSRRGTHAVMAVVATIAAGLSTLIFSSRFDLMAAYYGDGIVLIGEVMGQAMIFAQLVTLIALVGAVLFATIAVVRRLFSFHTTVSVCGVLLGSTALVVVLSVMNGFESDQRTKILGATAHIQISRDDGGDMLDWPALRDKIALVPGVVASTPFAISEVVIVGDTNPYNVIIKGIDPETIGNVTRLPRNVDDARGMARLYPEQLDEQLDLDVPSQPGGAGAETLDPPPDGMDVGSPDPVDLSRDRTPPGATPDAPSDAPSDEEADSRSGGKNTDVRSDEKPADSQSGGKTAGSQSGGKTADSRPGEKTAGSRSGEKTAEPGGKSTDSRFDKNPAGTPAAITEGIPQAEPSEPPSDARDHNKEHVLVVRPQGASSGSASPRARTLDGILVGRELAKQSHLSTGREVRLVSPLADPSNPDATGTPIPFNRDYRVAGTFFTGAIEYDLKFVYVTLESLQEFLDRGDGFDGIEVRTNSPDGTGPVAAALRTALGPEYRVQDWRELNRSLFSALKLEKIAMFVVLGIVIVVAGFSIIGNLVMVVVEKGKEIALLKTLGASGRSVVAIFVLQGLLIGMIGTVVGVAYGVIAVQGFTAYGIPIPSTVYYLDKLPMDLDGTTVGLVTMAGTILSAVATVYPAFLASILRPSVGLRH